MQGFDATPSYLDLIKAAEDLSSYKTNFSVRLAILSDSSTQFLAPVLKALAARRGCNLEIYTSPFDVFETEILDRQSDLHAFHPDFVFFLPCTQNLKARLYEEKERKTFVHDTVERWATLWKVCRRQISTCIIQANFAVPLERAWGNFELKAEGSVGQIFMKLNAALAEALCNNPDVLLCDVDYMSGNIGRINWFDERMWAVARIFCNPDLLPYFADRALDIVFASAGHMIKCVVLDLDNLLWGGVVGDEGLSGIDLGAYDDGISFIEFQKFLLELKRRGILLAVVSKNDLANALAPFRKHPAMILKEDDIAAFIVNWENKADNIRKLAKTLNIAFESMVFLDDSPFERANVRSRIPDIHVPDLPDDPAFFIKALVKSHLFETTTGEKDGEKRTRAYQEESRRCDEKVLYATEQEFLASLVMRGCLDRAGPRTLARIVELSNRSHQFNLMTRHYDEFAWQDFSTKTAYFPMAFSLSDRFGTYGVIAAFLLIPTAADLVIDELFISCRAFGRGVEDFLMNCIVSLAVKDGVRRIIGLFRPNGKNARAKTFYTNYGFVKAETIDDISRWELDPKDYRVRATFIEAKESGNA